jgi:CheY-like chemotaxis protein
LSFELQSFARPVMSSQSPTYRVLVVEDNPADTLLIERAFAECGHLCELRLVSSRSEALDLLSMDHFDLMLTNYGTDYEAAERFLRAVRAVTSRIPIVVFSGVLDPSSAYRAGANAFVRKESELQSFFEKIRGIMRFWAETAELPMKQTHVPAHNGTSSPAPASTKSLAAQASAQNMS